MLILGAGLNGCIAACKYPEAKIIEYLDTPTVHRAVLRFRSDAVSKITGIPFKEVEVQKGIIYRDQYVGPDIKMSNLYSRKVTGMALPRSIDNLKPSKRWIAPDDFHASLLARFHKRIEVSSKYVPVKIDEPIISTIPLPALCGILGIENPITREEHCKPIYVRTIKIPSADVYQTVYYPEPDLNAYRASMSGNMLIIEGIREVSSRECMKIMSDLGLYGLEHTFMESIVQRFGKFVPMDSIKRKRMMLELTTNHGIYSLGRHATWRKLMLDDLPKDLEVIERLIKIDEYDIRVGR